MPVMSGGKLSELGGYWRTRFGLTSDDIVLCAQRCDDRGLTNGEDACTGTPILDVQLYPCEVGR